MPETVITVSLNPAIDRVLEVDNFTLGAHQVGREVLRSPGGKAINVSRVLAMLGVRNIATGFLGTENRWQFEEVLQDPMISEQFFLLDGRTRENVTIVDPLAKQETHIRDIGLEVRPGDLTRLVRKLELMIRPGTIVIFGGSLPPGVSPAEFRRILELCQAAGARIAVDTSGQALREVAALALWLVKPNTVELEDWVGRELSNPAARVKAGRELGQRMSNVILTLGEEGAYLFRAGKAFRGTARVDPSAVRNTVGSGDAMLAGFVAGVLGGKTEQQAFAEGLACAAAKVCCVGPAKIRPAQMAQYRRKVQLEEIGEAP